MPGQKHADRFSQIQSASDFASYIQDQYKRADQTSDASGDDINRELAVANMLGDPELSTYLNKLSNEAKINLIHAIVINDMETITRVMFYPLQNKIASRDISIDAIRKINLPTPNQVGMSPDRWLSPLAKWVINQTLKDEKGQALEEYETELILINVMSRIPDTMISFPAKMYLCKEIAPALPEIRVAYAEYVESIEDPRSSGVISLTDFKSACANNGIDKGDYILLCLGLVQPLVGSSRNVRDFVNDIQQYYLDSNYDAAIRLITEMAEDKSLLDRKRSNAILDAGTSIQSIDKGKHYSRRFFENRLMAFSQAQFRDYGSVNEIAYRYLPDQFNAANDVPELIRLISALGNMPDNELVTRMEEIQASSIRWKGRGRLAKDKLYARHDEMKGKRGYSIFSHNPGVMKSSQPNYPDELTREQLRNAPTDVHGFDQRASYVATNPDSIFVTSLSSHALFFAALLEDYMKHNRGDAYLEIDVNAFVKAMVIANVSGGYHSIKEIMDAFAEPVVANIFRDYGVTLNLDWSDDALDAAFKDSQEYAKTLLLRRSVTSEIDKRNSLYDAITSNDTERVSALLNHRKAQRKSIDTIKSNLGSKVNVYETAISHHVSNDILRQLINSDRSRVGLDSVMESCLRHRHLEGIRLLHELGYEFTKSDLKAAIKADDVAILRFLVEEVKIPLMKKDGTIKRELLNAHRSVAMYDYLVSLGIVHGDGNMFHHVVASHRYNDDKCAEARRILSTTPSFQSELNHEGSTPLHLAMSLVSSSPDLAMTFLKHPQFDPATLNVFDATGYTPLMRALTTQRNFSLIKSLIEAGTDVTLVNSSNQSIIDILSKLPITAEMESSVRLIINEIAQKKPELLPGLGSNANPITQPRLIAFIAKVLTERNQHALTDEATETRAAVRYEPERLFTAPKRIIPPQEFAQAMLYFKKVLGNISRTESIGVPYLQEKVMLMYELLDKLASQKLPDGWHEKIVNQVTEIERLLTNNKTKPCPQLSSLIMKIKDEADAFNHPDKKRLGPV